MYRFNPEIHHRRSIRLKRHDYSHAGAYFVTVCSQYRECLFGNVVDGEMILNDAGKMVRDVWHELPSRFPLIQLDSFIVMPNHVHAIINIVGAALALPQKHAERKMGAASGAPITLAIVIRALKSISSIRVNRLLSRQGQSLWQRNYYEHIIRNDRDLFQIRQYIDSNPAKWEEDENHPGNL